MTSPAKLQQDSRIYHEKHGQQRGQMFTPPGNKPVYYSAHQGIFLDRKIGHTHHHSMALSYRSTAAPKRVEVIQSPSIFINFNWTFLSVNFTPVSDVTKDFNALIFYLSGTKST